MCVNIPAAIRAQSLKCGTWKHTAQRNEEPRTVQFPNEIRPNQYRNRHGRTATIKDGISSRMTTDTHNPGNAQGRDDVRYKANGSEIACKPATNNLQKEAECNWRQDQRNEKGRDCPPRHSSGSATTRRSIFECRQDVRPKTWLDITFARRGVERLMFKEMEPNDHNRHTCRDQANCSSVASFELHGSRCCPSRFQRYASGLNLECSVCAVHAVDVRTGIITGSLRWKQGNQIFAINWLPGEISRGFP